ncbi:uncharacterized protein TRAVEDRAFT_149576 [Trametes versicolor FP-101664 SS1]|uniref:uncharacterized protein n=1 Tax=Trametes versicolor (strain FP-101664) TaxID=717944 RepID=UPI00046227A2|nr:uncharacterized protein TRAVEDRAFT_149576 [Trametes versicolor FP-101664 SS1]EIW57284.1 hypothetical protein TRAVEDRAFT_149576 [Trametes versicolor FP-101664 SS1]
MASTTTPAAATTTLRHASSAEPSEDDARHSSLLRRSWYAMSDVLSPFSPSALASLPKKTFQIRPRYTRVDHIPDAEQDEDGQMPTVRDYHAINSVPPQVRVPKKIATPVKVEGKVWFANERTWVAYLQTSVLIGTLALALFNTSKDSIARNLAYAYAGLSVAVLIYGYAVYQHRITMIRRRDPGHFDQIVGPVLISAFLFCAVLVNFVLRVRELQSKNITIPGIPFL